MPGDCLMFGMGFLSGTQSLLLARLCEQSAPRALLSLPPQHQDDRTKGYCQAFVWVLGDWIPVLVTVWKTDWWTISPHNFHLSPKVRNWEKPLKMLGGVEGNSLMGETVSCHWVQQRDSLKIPNTITKMAWHCLNFSSLNLASVHVCWQVLWWSSRWNASL